MLQLIVQINSKVAQEFLSMDFLSKSQSCYKSGFKQLRGKTGSQNKYSYFCNEHFEPSCFIVRPGKLVVIQMTMLSPQFFHHFLITTKELKKQKRKSPHKWKPAVILASPSKVARTLTNGHGYANVLEPTQIHEQLQVEIKKLQKKVKVLKEIVCQCNKCVQNMKQLMEDLKEKRLVSNQQHELLAHNFEGVSGHLFTDQASNAKCGNKHSSQ